MATSRGWMDKNKHGCLFTFKYWNFDGRGVICDHNGSWLKGVSLNIGPGLVDNMELQGVAKR